MYTVDDLDIVHPQEDIPQSSVGAPLPVVFSDEFTTVVAYLTQNSASALNDDNALIKFDRCYAHMFGPPNDEAFAGHPLADRGLEPYSAFQIEQSSWVRQLERMNSVHPYHKPERFDRLNHYILAFHDSTFECLAESFSVKVVPGPLQSLMGEIAMFLNESTD